MLVLRCWGDMVGRDDMVVDKEDMGDRVANMVDTYDREARKGVWGRTVVLAEGQ